MHDISNKRAESINDRIQGNITIEKPIGSAQLMKSPSIPKSFHLYQNYPNQFNQRTIIKYNLPYPDFVTLSVYDIRGILVITLINKEISAGFHQIEWKGITDAKEHAPTGVYFIRFETSSYSQSKKILLLKWWYILFKAKDLSF